MSFGYLTALDAIEQQAIRHLQLSAAPTISTVEGEWKGGAVSLLASRWTGPKVALFRTVRLVGDGLEIANVMGIARSPLGAPILGIDLVAARRDAGVVVADLSPLGPGASHPSLPEWAQGIFSSRPVIERVTPETAASALTTVLQLVDAFIEAVDAATASIDAAGRHAAVERYRIAHLADERMTTMLSHMFGAERAAMLMRDVLFPVIEDVDVHA
jgi:hypothetical protein